MIEITFEEATVEALADANVIMVVGIGDRHMSNVLLGRKEFARVAGNPALVAETKIVRVKVEGDEQLQELKGRVIEAMGGLDPDVKDPEIKVPEAKDSEVKVPEAKKADVKKSASRKAKAKVKEEAEEEEPDEDE